MFKAVSFLFALCCIATALVSNSIMGAGMWFWVIIVTGITVFMTSFIPKLMPVGAVLAGLLAIVSIGAVLLGLVAATIGGSFRLGNQEVLLLFLFFLIMLTGFSLVYINKKNMRSARMFHA